MTNKNSLAIGPGMQVTLHFAIKLASGDVVDSNFDKHGGSSKRGAGDLAKTTEGA